MQRVTAGFAVVRLLQEQSTQTIADVNWVPNTHTNMVMETNCYREST